MPRVFQYGSNATRGRLSGANRLNGYVVDRGRACTVDDYDIAFNVWSQTNGCAASDLVPTRGRKAWGVLYEIPDEFIRGTRTDGQKTLEEIEGPRYEERTIRVRSGESQEGEAVTFVVRETERRARLATSAAYVSWIVYGLRDHGVPEDYIAHIVEVAIQTNECASDGSPEQIRHIRNL